MSRCECCRERADGLFTPFCYLASKLVGELTIAFCNCVVFGALVFYLVNLDGSYPLFFLVNFCTTSIGIGAPPPGAVFQNHAAQTAFLLSYGLLFMSTFVFRKSKHSCSFTKAWQS